MAGIEEVPMTLTMKTTTLVQLLFMLDLFDGYWCGLLGNGTILPTIPPPGSIKWYCWLILVIILVVAVLACCFHKNVVALCNKPKGATMMANEGQPQPIVVIKDTVTTTKITASGMSEKPTSSTSKTGKTNSTNSTN